MQRASNIPPKVPSAEIDSRWTLLALSYAALIVYGSLYPFTGWTREHHGLLDFVFRVGEHRFHAADALTNVLAYIPFGLLLARTHGQRRSLAVTILTATLAGASLSFAMEFLQQFLPSRVASVDDLVTNSIGTLIGAVLAGLLRANTMPLVTFARWRRHWFRPGRVADLGLIAIALWTLSQWTPLVPSLDLGELRHGVAPLWRTLQHPDQFLVAQWAAYALDVAGLALLSRTLANAGRPIAKGFLVFVIFVLLYKVPVVSRQLSLEAIAGAMTGIVLALTVWSLRMEVIAWISAALIVGGFAVAELHAESPGFTYPFTWVPFKAQLEHPLIGIASILENIWPAVALAYLARYAGGTRHRLSVAWIGGIALAILAFGCEWYQQYLPGRIGDITTVLLMAAAWGVACGVPVGNVEADASDRPSLETPASHRGRPLLIAASLGLLAAIGASTAVVSRHASETRVDESRLPRLPAPAELPPVRLPHFNFIHPRLPSPTPVDLGMLLAKNPAYLRQLRAGASNGRGEFDMVILQAYLDPGSVDMTVLFHRLMDLKFAWRGHEQGKPLAVAYDWLYSQWTDSQRAQLRAKLEDGCNYLIDVIRNDRLSPYNVILYNSPLQALMACSIALYGDDPRGEPVMRFTYDYWKNRVLPVWRQVMGKGGGWHEGGEYVGIGIGQAVYELPAMWRSATGEDLIATEPGIRGFLDFLIYRTQPDGTHFRWGDGGFFDRIVPDASPLALELRDAAAYGLRPPSQELVPTGWPWGPLNDVAMNDPSAILRRPLTHVFDGIGMIVARSDWTADATYVTFKAGDNYWSHTHLDQGAFTIYKGGALAIDSGLYGPSYGSDHHMNYDYQTIAHNTITVTDPDDTVPAPGKEKPRPIANDGGQRRIGSGWGVEAAPLDRTEWEAKRDIYHTGTLDLILDEDGLTVAQADITPAYTNSRSGHGTFSDRTRRVERFWRTFGYDRVDDVIVIFDQVKATKAAFRKRWLLHTLDAPEITQGGFRIRVAPETRPGHAGGVLTGKVLLPTNAVINAIGGHGLEFLVDDRNYDESGTLQEKIRKLGPNNGEPGAWRIEVSPPQDETDDAFLVVLLPTLADATPVHRVRLLESGNRVGCEIIGPHRTTQWWFEPGREGGEIRVLQGDESRTHPLWAPVRPPAKTRDWLDRMRKWLE